MKSVHILGLMSGSSLDGLDMALCRFRGTPVLSAPEWSLLDAVTIPFPDELKASLAKATALPALELFALEAAYSAFCAEKISYFVGQSTEPDYVASHGHTVFHHPERGFTTQLGNGGFIAARTGIPCIADFRVTDIALGGQGAPLAPIVEKWLFRGHQLYLNLGGIANISCHTRDQIISYDVVPCNQVLNHLAQKTDAEYDAGGHLARKGNIIPGLKQKWSENAYFNKPFPKSMDNTWVKEYIIDELKKWDSPVNDLMRTAADFIALQLSRNIRDLTALTRGSAYSLMITGGGAHNTFLIECLKAYLPDINISFAIPDKEIVDFKEAILMAFMGYLRVICEANIISQVTGAGHDSTGGAIYMP